MIIFGTTSLTFTKDKGTFFCPQCFGESPYQHKSVRRFFTLYFIPIIPLDRLGEFVRCRGCRGNFDPVVLQMTANDYEQVAETEYHDELLRAVALMTVAGDSASDESMRTAAEQYVAVGGPPIGPERVIEEITAARESEETVESFLRNHRDEWSPEGKDKMVEALFLVASASGDLHADQQAQLERIPDALEISEDHFRQIIANAVAGE